VGGRRCGIAGWTSRSWLVVKARAQVAPPASVAPTTIQNSFTRGQKGYENIHALECAPLPPPLPLLFRVSRPARFLQREGFESARTLILARRGTAEERAVAALPTFLSTAWSPYLDALVAQITVSSPKPGSQVTVYGVREPGCASATPFPSLHPHHLDVDAWSSMSPTSPPIVQETSQREIGALTS
jgi:hypothetical protein